MFLLTLFKTRLVDNWCQSNISVRYFTVVPLKIDRTGFGNICMKCTSGRPVHGLVVDDRFTVQYHGQMPLVKSDIHCLPFSGRFFSRKGRGYPAVKCTHVMRIQRFAVGIQNLDLIHSAQINTAVAEMDKVVQQNAANAEENASTSEEMNAQADQMKGYVEELAALVGGRTDGGDNGRSLAFAKKYKTKVHGGHPAPANADYKGEEASPNNLIPLDDEDFSDF